MTRSVGDLPHRLRCARGRSFDMVETERNGEVQVCQCENGGLVTMSTDVMTVDWDQGYNLDFLGYIVHDLRSIQY